MRNNRVGEQLGASLLKRVRGVTLIMAVASVPAMLLMSVGAPIAAIIRGPVLTKSFMLDKVISDSLFQSSLSPIVQLFPPITQARR